MVKRPRWYEKNISFLESMGRIIDHNGILICDRHDDFQSRMPVQRVIFRLVVVVELDARKGIVRYRFLDTV